MLGACLAGLFGGPATAQIIAVGADGSTTTFAGPVLVSPQGISPILQTAAPVAPQIAVQAAIRDAAGRHQLNEKLIAAVAWEELRWRQDAVSPKGARGIMQLMPGTAQKLGVDAASLHGNIDGGAAYLAAMMQRFDGDIMKSLAAYNAGPDAVARYGGVPPYRETQNYVDAIMGRLAAAETQTLPEVQR